MNPTRPTPSRFPGWRIPANAPVAGGGEASPSAVGPLSPTGDRDTGDQAEHDVAATGA